MLELGIASLGTMVLTPPVLRPLVYGLLRRMPKLAPKLHALNQVRARAGGVPGLGGQAAQAAYAEPGVHSYGVIQGLGDKGLGLQGAPCSASCCAPRPKP